MKKTITLFLLFCGINSAMLAQDVPEKQQALITKIAADWCSPCGTWGWTMFENLIQDNDANAVLITAHHSGNLVTQTSSAFADNLNHISQPRFYLGNQDQAINSISIESKRQSIKEAVDNLATQAPIVNADEYFGKYQNAFFPGSLW